MLLHLDRGLDELQLLGLHQHQIRVIFYILDWPILDALHGVQVTQRSQFLVTHLCRFRADHGVAVVLTTNMVTYEGVRMKLNRDETL